MSEQDPSRAGSSPKVAGTLLGVPAPRVESNVESPLRSPVFVRAGTSVADVEPPPVPRMALPSRPPVAMDNGGAQSLSPGKPTGLSWVGAMLQLPVQIAGGELSLWMVAGPFLLGALAVLGLVVGLAASGDKPAPQPVASGSAAMPAPSVADVAKPPPKPSLASLSELEGKSPDSLNVSELIKLAEGRAEKQRDAAKALREKVEASPALVKDRAVQGELLRLTQDSETARDALAAMAASEPPVAADLLYEVWTGTTEKSDATELARALVYSKEVRPKASAPLGVALELRVAEKCEDYKAALPKALKDGDRRVLHLLTKLNVKRGCGPKKTEDCFACLRDQADELTATINAVKSRRAPAYAAPMK